MYRYRFSLLLLFILATFASLSMPLSTEAQEVRRHHQDQNARRVSGCARERQEDESPDLKPRF